MNIDKINIYRITHIDNIPYILRYGITHISSKYSDPNYIAIGDTSLINTREERTVYVTNGGDEIIEEITLGDYIPFYFGIKMPMLYVIQQGGNFVPNAINPENIVYLVCLLKCIYERYLCYFSDGHATDMLTTFYNRDEIHNLVEIIDWRAVKISYWGGEDNLDIKRKKQAEFLVKGDIHPSCIRGYVCYNEVAKNRLIAFGVNEEIIKIKPTAYY